MNKSKELFEKYNDYLIIDFNNLFVSTTISEEILFYSHINNCNIGSKFNETIALFKNININAKKELWLYSGGERVIISCCILFVAIFCYQITNKKVLFCNSLESISQHNREIIFRLMKTLNKTNKIEFYEYKNTVLKVAI